MAAFSRPYPAKKIHDRYQFATTFVHPTTAVQKKLRDIFMDKFGPRFKPHACASSGCEICMHAQKFYVKHVRAATHSCYLELPQPGAALFLDIGRHHEVPDI